MPSKMATRKRPAEMVYGSGLLSHQSQVCGSGLLSQQSQYREQPITHTESWVREQKRMQERTQEKVQARNGLGEVNVTIRNRSKPRTVIQLDKFEGDSASQNPAQRRTPKPSFVQLTRRTYPTYTPSWYSNRETSFMGNRDEDVAEPEQPRGMFRKEIRSILIEDDEDLVKDVEVVLPSAKRVKMFHTAQYRPHIRGTPQQERQQQLQGRSFALHPSPHQPRVQNVPQSCAPARNAVPQTNLTQRLSQATDIIQPKAYFFTIAPEIRDKIYRYLLVKKNPINVTKLWTEAVRSTSRRSRGCLRQQQVAETDTIIDTRILRVCRQVAVEGTRVLYSENKFRYMLRDSALSFRSLNLGRRHNHNQIIRAIREWRERDDGVHSGRGINVEKYGYLLRHVSLELEPNRHESQYEDLMVAALWSLVNYDSRNAGSAIPAWFPRGKIYLHTLSITISPENNRTGGMNVVPFFAEGHRIAGALFEIDTNFLNINVKIARPAKKRRRGTQAQPQDDEDDDADDEDESDEDMVPRHLETTIDMRFLPRHLETLRHNEIDRNMWQNDKLIRKRRVDMGHLAKASLQALDQRIRMAAVDTEQAVRQGLWEDYFTAERRREMHRARDLALFEGVDEEEDELYSSESNSDSDSESDDDGEDKRRTRPRKSLIIHIQRFDGQLRSFRA
ncbi:hypothetical protein B0T25DRAFT_515182 [Lasiosphaeria hispida]|uniref:Uncharacterized protein n=1 Tax=Lasiosphaeria hispida TaxID=260671 RepID=A0AAJ0HQZ5_9PEZI|nr:hypothetical protein B0T25DRAFT_515182 [Lasiosphaeria hispida]